MGVLANSLRIRVKAAENMQCIPRVLSNVTRPGPFKQRVKRITEAFPRRFWFYHPVKCPGGKLAHRPKRVGRKEIYTCPDGSKKMFQRWSRSETFFRVKYGRGGEFAQGLYAVLRKLGYKVRLVLGYWHGADALWVEIWNKKWIPLDPAAKHGYGRKFPKPGMRVIALQNSKSKLINRTKNYKCTSGCLNPGGY
jgi:hypothetical protein